MPDQDSRQIISDISVLYELSLAVGQSLDLRTNCEQFIRTLMARKNLAYASVWVRRRHLPEPEHLEKETDGNDLVLVYANPEFRASTRVLAEDHPLTRLLEKKAVFSVAASDKDFARVATENELGSGVFAIFRLGEIGMLKLFSMTREARFPPQALNQLENVLAKFTVSLEGCLAHYRMVHEITERKEVEAALRQSEEKYRNVVELASDGIVILQDGVIKYTNSRLMKLVGSTSEQVVGSPFTSYVHPDEAPKLGDNYRRRMTGEQFSSIYETVLVRPDGHLIYAELNAALIEFEGRPADMVFIRDISDRKQTEAASMRLAMAVEQTADAVIITGTDGTIEYVNPAFERITGHSREEVLGKTPRLVKSGKQDGAVYDELWATITRGEVWRGRFQNRRKDGSLYTCDTIITPTRHEDGTIINFVGVQRDVTRELQMEEQYLQAQKMESMGRLAGGIAHDFNNIMTAVLGFGSMVLDQLGENHPLRHAVEQIVSAGERATNLTRQLLTFSRKQMVEVRILNMNAVIMEMYQLLRRALGEDVELVTLLDDEAGYVKADVGLLQQVVMNLAINARDAMPRGGQLTIVTAHTYLDEAFCRAHVQLKPGDYILLTIRDTGCGMNKQVLDHVFEPFFTTKPKGKGTGLGLATVYGIVRQCNGHIEILSEVGKGTEIRVWLPQTEATAETLPVELEEKVQKGSETILVVEDEDLVRDLTVRILKSLGYHVLEAAHGKEGLALFEKATGPIHLVLTDVVMPQMGGPEMAERIQQLRPSIKVLYTSGFTESAVLERGVALGKVTLIQKPYTREILALKIRQALDEK